MAIIPPASPGAVPPPGAAFAARTSATSGPASYDASGILRRADADGTLQELLQGLLDRLGYEPGGTVVPTTISPPTFSPSVVTLPAGAAPGTFVANVSPVPTGATRSALSVNDGRLRYRAGSNQTIIEVGTTAITEGTTLTLTATDTLPGAVGSPATGNVTVEVAVPVAPGQQRTIGTRPVTGTGNASGTVDSFVDTFVPGTVLASDDFGIKIGGTTIAAQYRPATFWDDGSVCSGVFAYEPPAMTDGQAGTLELVANLAGRPTGTNLTMATALSGRSASVTITPVGRAAITIDLLAGLETTPWRRGPLVVEHRATTTLTTQQMGSAGVRVQRDVQVTKDGLLSIDLRIANDQLIPGDFSTATVTYAVRVVMDGVVKIDATGVKMTRYQSFLRRFAQKVDGSNPARPFTTPDPERGSLAGFVPNGDSRYGIAPSWSSQVKAMLNSAGWNDPMGTRSLTQYMPNSGGRRDIGFMPNWAFCLLTTPHKDLYRVTCDIAEAAAGIPWHHWLPNGGKNGTGAWINCQDTMIQLDGRVAEYPNYDSQENGWTVEAAHDPEASSMAYFVSARRSFADNLCAHAGWAVNGPWPGNRGYTLNFDTGEGVNLVRGNQIRATAWGLRNVYRAAYLVEASQQPHDDFHRRAFNGNMNYIINNMAAWDAAVGELKGIWTNYTYENGKVVPPWMHDYGMTVMVGAGVGGNAKARTVLAWMANFTANRFLPQGGVWNRNNGVSFLIYCCTSDGAGVKTFRKTWAQVDAYLKTIIPNEGQEVKNPGNQGHDRGTNPNLQFNTTGPSISYPTHLNAMLAYIFPDDPRFARATEYLVNAGYSILTPATLSSDEESSIATFALAPGHTRANVQPVVLPGQVFAITSARKTAVVRTRGAYPTAFTLSGADAGKWKIDNAGVIEPVVAVSGANNLTVVATSRFATQPSVATPVVINVTGTVTPEDEVTPPVGQAPVVTAGQTFTVQRNVPVGTKVLEVAYTGGTPLSGTATNSDGTPSDEFELVNDNDLVTKISPLSPANGQRDVRVSLVNATGASAPVQVLGTLTDAPAPAQPIYATAATTYRPLYSMNRKLVGGYTGPAFWARRGDGAHQDIGFLGNGTVDLATLATFANGGPVTAEIWYAQDGSAYHFTQSDPTKQFVVQNASGILSLESGSAAGRSMRTPTVPVQSLNLGAVAAVRVDAFAFNGRIVSVVAPDSDDDTTLPGASSLLMWEGEKVSVRQNDQGNSNQELRTTGFTNLGKMVVAAAYRAGAVALARQDGNTGTGAFTWVTEFGNVQFRMGWPIEGEHNQLLGGTYELAMLGATSAADLGVIQANMKAKYGTP